MQSITWRLAIYLGPAVWLPPLTCLPCQINSGFHLGCCLSLLPSYWTSCRLISDIIWQLYNYFVDVTWHSPSPTLYYILYQFRNWLWRLQKNYLRVFKVWDLIGSIYESLQSFSEGVTMSPPPSLAVTLKVFPNHQTFRNFWRPFL